MRTSDPKLVAINFKPVAASWTGMQAGMTFAELRALGIARVVIMNKIRTGAMVFDPPVLKNPAFGRPMGWRPKQKAKLPKRPCLACNKPFQPDGRFNRLCKRCNLTAGSVSPYENNG
jgi:hypothetical protein